MAISRKWKKRLFWFSLSFLFVCVLVGLLVETVPPVSMTTAVMFVMKQRILQYASENDQLPRDLSTLPLKKNKINSVVDGWGWPIKYEVDNDGTVSLTSFGKDGRPGGEGDAADIVCSFVSKQPDGSWSPELVEWKTEVIPQWDEKK